MKTQKDEFGNNIQQIVELRKKAHRYYLNKSAMYKSFLKMEELTFRAGSLSKKEKELIAIGISVVINCESCMEWHTGQALKNNASEEEILEAVEVGMEMSGGPGTVSARFVMQAIEYHRR